jgi:tetraacyldisaccharide 4'-kinase
MSTRRPWAWPLVPVYRAALAVKDALRGEPKRLQWPVVSVGSLSAGGAGKTPVVIALALLLKQRGWGVDVLSRGYGRAGRGVECVVGDDAGRFGDEPVVIAARAGVPVWVGAERLAAGHAAELQTRRTRWDAEGVHLLDDGFQHRQLVRAMDVVLVTGEDMDDALLPAGNLREPMSALGRADVVVVREEEIVREEFKAQVWARMREGAQMWVARRRLVFPNVMKTLGAGLRPVAFCAIARPENFAAMLLDAGCGVVETVAFADHHGYTKADVLRVIEVANGLNASGFVTTEKDAVKLTAELRALLEAVGPLMVVALVVEFVDAEAVARSIEVAVASSEQQILRLRATRSAQDDNQKDKNNSVGEQ